VVPRIVAFDPTRRRAREGDSQPLQRPPRNGEKYLLSKTLVETQGPGVGLPETRHNPNGSPETFSRELKVSGNRRFNCAELARSTSFCVLNFTSEIQM
jgi:hypothetical protein